MHRNCRHTGRARRALTAVLALLLALPVASVAVGVSPAGASVAMELTAGESAQLHRLNEWRGAQGLPPLQIDPVTQAKARSWTLAMAARGALSHSPDIAADCAEASSNCSAWAENVGYAGDEAGVFRAFVGSGSHAATMRSPDADRVGIGVYVDARGTTWVTQRYIRCGGCTNDAAATQANSWRARNRGYASALYGDLLSRSGTSAEVEAIVDRLTYLVPRGSITAGFATGPERITRLVDGYYREALGRPADASGLRAWVDRYRAGDTLTHVVASLYGSGEFFSRSGGTNREWVDALYRDVFDRAPDRAGLDHWTAVADGGASRVSIADALYQSTESRRRRVRSLYDEFLGRAPDEGGLADWTERLRDGRDERLAWALVQSDEYYGRVA